MSVRRIEFWLDHTILPRRSWAHSFSTTCIFLALLNFVKHVGTVPLAVITGTGGHGVPGHRHIEVYKRPWPFRGSRGDGNGDASSSLRSPLVRYGISDTVSFVTQCAMRRTAGVSFQLPDGRHTGLFSVPVNYALCSSVV